VVSVLTVINRSIINVGAEEASNDEDETLQPRIDCDVEENSTLSFFNTLFSKTLRML
jgi:hypothetical protein